MDKIFAALFFSLLTACVSQNPPNTPQITQNPPPPANPANNPNFPENTAQAANYLAWKEDFINRAIAHNISPKTVHQLMDSAVEKHSVSSSDKNQAEFVKSIWEYVEGAVSQTRINNGRAKLASVKQVTASSPVPAEIVAAIWGVESGYGANTGNIKLADSLGTLAYEGRRRKFAEEQLIALMRLLDSGDLDWHPLTGSWAGGMGDTQFIPATWQQFGVDANGDGRRNAWTTSDALASTANYLAKSGWIRSVAPIYEVQLPQKFDYSLIGAKKTCEQWRQLGLNILDASFNPQTEATLWLPAGINGPKLLQTKNFSVIKVYNHSDNYALAVSLLARAIGGGSAKFHTDWPRGEGKLSRSQIAQIQTRLTQLGFDTKGNDGVAGTNTRRAFSNWQKANGQIPDGFMSPRSAAPLLR